VDEHADETGVKRHAGLTPQLFSSLLAALSLLVCSIPAVAGGSPPTPIQHIVIIDQENHSFDNVLGILCLQLKRCLGPQVSSNGKPIGFLHDGSSITLPNAGDIVSFSPHNHDAQVTAVNGGAMNGFDLMVERRPRLRPTLHVL
jgi:Phosphoesterase family